MGRKSSVTAGSPGSAAPAANDIAFEQLCAELELDEPAPAANAAGGGEVDITVLDGEVPESPTARAMKLEDQVSDICLTDAELELLEKQAEADGSLSLGQADGSLSLPDT